MNEHVIHEWISMFSRFHAAFASEQQDGRQAAFSDEQGYLTRQLLEHAGQAQKHAGQTAKHFLLIIRELVAAIELLSQQYQELRPTLKLFSSFLMLVQASLTMAIDQFDDSQASQYLPARIETLSIFRDLLIAQLMHQPDMDQEKNKQREGLLAAITLLDGELAKLSQQMDGQKTTPDRKGVEWIEVEQF